MHSSPLRIAYPPSRFCVQTRDLIVAIRSNFMFPESVRIQTRNQPPPRAQEVTSSTVLLQRRAVRFRLMIQLFIKATRSSASRKTTRFFLLLVLSGVASNGFAQKPRMPPGGHLAIVADERLAALRTTPDLSARLLRRLSRGRFVSVRGSSRSRDG